MFACHLLTTLGLFLNLSALTTTVDAESVVLTLAAKTKHHAAHGRITEVATDATSITVQIHPHKKKNAPAPATPPAAVEKTFKVDKETKILFVSGPKGAREYKPATFADLHKGEHVVVVLRSGQSSLADKVAIMQPRK
jgi:hypothetical protein